MYVDKNATSCEMSKKERGRGEKEIQISVIGNHIILILFDLSFNFVHPSKKE